MRDLLRRLMSHLRPSSVEEQHREVLERVADQEQRAEQLRKQRARFERLDAQANLPPRGR